MTLTLPAGTLRLWQLRVVMLTALVDALIVGFGGVTKVFLIILAVPTLLGAVAVFWYLPRFHKNWRLSTKDNIIEVENGVIIKTVHILPCPRLIYAGSYATPLGRLLGLEGVTLKAARGRLILPEIYKQDAEDVIKLGIRNEE